MLEQKRLAALKPKPEYLPLFNPGEPFTTGDSESVAGRLDLLQCLPTRCLGTTDSLLTVSDGQCHAIPLKSTYPAIPQPHISTPRP